MSKGLYGTCFCGNEASVYAKEHGYLDYATFAKAFDAVLNNDIMSLTADIGYWEPILDGVTYTDLEDNERTYDEYLNDTENSIFENYPEIMQTYIVSDRGADLIKDYEVGCLWYNEALDMYVWGITHWGTSWDYVLTDIKLNTGEF